MGVDGSEISSFVGTAQQALARLAEPDVHVRAGELRELLDFYWSEEFQEELLGWPDEV